MRKLNAVEEALDTVQRAIDEATEGLSDAEYLEVLEEVASDCEIRIEAKKVESGE